MGYTTSTIHGIEVPDSSEANNVPEDIGKVVTALEGGSIVRRLTGAAIAALTAPEKPAGLVVYNTTTNKLQISDGTNFADVAYADLVVPQANIRAAVVSTSSYTTGGVAVSFSSALASTPLLVIGQTVNAGDATPLHIMPFGVTASGFSYKAFDNLGVTHERDAGSPVLFNYLAVVV